MGVVKKNEQYVLSRKRSAHGHLLDEKRMAVGNQRNRHDAKGEGPGHPRYTHVEKPPRPRRVCGTIRPLRADAHCVAF
eukprot:scaffold267659_cov35-Tisochrysis_lutea.AAC.3